MSASARVDMPEGMHRGAACQDPEALASGFRKAMRRLTSTVSILATSEDGERIGMAATAVSSLCATPPAILACVSHGASIHKPLMRRGVFSVNLLRSAHEDLVGIFSGKLKGPERFLHGRWGEEHGLPYLVDGQATLFCKVDHSFTYGDHEVIVGLVQAVKAADHISPLLWQDGKTACARPSLRTV